MKFEFKKEVFVNAFAKQHFKIRHCDWGDVLIETFKQEMFTIAVEDAITKLMKSHDVIPTNVRYCCETGKEITKGFVLKLDGLLPQDEYENILILVFEKEFDAILYVTKNIESYRNEDDEIEYKYKNGTFLFEELVQTLYRTMDLEFCRF